MRKVFPYPIYFGRAKIWPTKFLGTEIKEIVDGDSLYSISPPSPIHKLFDTRNFLQLRRVLRRNCSLPRENKSSTEIRDTPSFPLSHP